MFRSWRHITGLILIAAFSVAMTVLAPSIGLPIWAQNAPPTSQQPAPQETLPSPQIHPLPASLGRWQDPTNQGDYFTAVQPMGAGYLIWSQFPVHVYIEPSTNAGNINAEGDRSQAWVDAVTQAVQEWNGYLPLEITPTSEAADISIWRSAPPLRVEADHTFRARSAETRYEIYVKRLENAPAVLMQRFTVYLRPSQTADYIRAAARHELGHALGIWGHSPVQTDALYFSQVRTPSPISARDINTLKRIYEQPTRLGWALVKHDATRPN